MQEPGVTDRLAAWVADHRTPLPDEVVRATRRLTLDGLGCAIFGASMPWSRSVAAFAHSQAAEGAAASTVWGTDDRLPTLGAALVNGTSMHAFEYDDLHPQAVIHAGAQVLPAVLGLAEARQRQGRTDTGRDILRSLAIGFEVGARIGRATGAGQLARGFHPSPNTGVFASAAAVSRLLGADAAQTAHALGVAGSFGGYLMAAQYGAMVKRVHPGHAAQSGLTAALLAEHGLTGTRAVLETPYGGFAATYADATTDQLHLVTEGLGERWHVPDYTIKYYPCCGSNHTAIDAWWDLTADRAIAAAEIRRLTVHCSTLTLEHVGWPYHPDSVTTAQMNLRYCLAAAVVDGQFTVDQVDEKRIADPDLLEAVDRIDVQADPAIDALGRDRRHRVRLVAELRDGTVLETEREHPRGSARHPLTDDEVVAKFTSLASRALDDFAVQSLVDTVMTLGEKSPFDTVALAGLTAPPASLHHSTNRGANS